MVFADEFEIGVRERLVECFEYGGALSRFGLDGELFHRSADRAAIDGIRFAEILFLDNSLDFGGFEALGEGEADFVAADEVDAVDVVSAGDHRRDSDHHQNAREDESGFPVTEEVDLRLFDDRQHRQFGDVAEIDQEFEQEAADNEGAENGSENTDGERDSETFDRAGAEENQDACGEQGGDVGVDDRGEGFFVTGGQSALERFADFEFLAHALEDQDVGVDRHTDG